MGKAFPAEEQQRFTEAWNKKMPIAEMAKAFGVGPCAIGRRVTKLGLKKRPPGGFGRKDNVVPGFPGIVLTKTGKWASRRGKIHLGTYATLEEAKEAWTTKTRTVTIRYQEWTDELTNRLVNLWNEGVSATKIGDELGFTRNAIIGKKDRLDKAGHFEFQHKPKTRDKGKRKVKPWVKPVVLEERKVEPVSVMAPFVFDSGRASTMGKRSRGALPKEEKMIGSVRFRDAKPSDCRWIAGNPKDPDVMVCGKHKVTGSSYCAEHDRIARVPRRGYAKALGA